MSLKFLVPLGFWPPRRHTGVVHMGFAMPGPHKHANGTYYLRQRVPWAASSRRAPSCSLDQRSGRD